MAFVGDITTVLLGTLTLVLLSLYTLVNCRQELPRQRPASDDFLFGGVARRHSLAGTIGYAFSITYFGATTIYGHLYRGWFVIMAASAVAVAILIIQLIIRRATLALRNWSTRENLLLSFLDARLGPDNAKQVYGVYVIIYMALLIEELAVSRMLLNAVFRGHPAVMGLLLATISAVILAYLKWGGFRAVLIADFEQLKLLFPFVLAIGFLSFRSADRGPTFGTFQLRAHGNSLTFISAMVMLVAWIVGSIDFYSRLNYRSIRDDASSLSRFASLSLALTTLVFMIGAAYGMMLPAEFSRNRSPSGFTESGVAHAIVLGYRSTAIIFFASVFCMIFSTVNTLTIAIFQASRYASHPWPQFKDLHKIMLWAMALSCILWPDSVSAVGLFICALMVLPLVMIVAALSDRVRRALPSTSKFLWLSLIVATAGFVVLYRYFTDYANMPYLGVLVLGSTLICASVAKAHERMRSRYGS